ncbi:hypothetical protein HDV05_002758 [Chytridiales sp. JEL 0842]|nr:hypothetical protein HDV05_002758 [Chytridiales sp. JEL 0842]
MVTALPTSHPITQFVLVTGGAGYIGSHTVVELLQGGFNVIIVDNLTNSSKVALQQVSKITGRNDFLFYEADVTDEPALAAIFARHSIVSVIHFAGVKSVTESVSNPLKYYHINFQGTATLLKCMTAAGCSNLIFSSSATVYGHPEYVPIDEKHPARPINPYGRSKYMAEELIRDYCAANPTLNATILRYFNPIGAHPSGLIGEDPRGVPANLLPYITQVLCGRLQQLSVYGSDYDTKDGSGVRDFIHVVDLAKGHISAMKSMQKKRNSGCVIYNMGTGTGYSVFEMVRVMEEVSGKPVPLKVQPRRPGDSAVSVAQATLVEREIGWRTTLGLKDMCQHAWNWQCKNPLGFSSVVDASSSSFGLDASAPALITMGSLLILLGVSLGASVFVAPKTRFPSIIIGFLAMSTVIQILLWNVEPETLYPQRIIVYIISWVASGIAGALLLYYQPITTATFSCAFCGFLVGEWIMAFQTGSLIKTTSIRLVFLLTTTLIPAIASFFSRAGDSLLISTSAAMTPFIVGLGIDLVGKFGLTEGLLAFITVGTRGRIITPQYIADTPKFILLGVTGFLGLSLLLIHAFVVKPAAKKEQKIFYVTV